jgi:hypothetical protein
MFVLTVSILQNPTDSTKLKPLTSWGATLRKNARRLIGSRRERRLIGYIPAAHRLSISKALHQRWLLHIPKSFVPRTTPSIPPSIPSCLLRSQPLLPKPRVSSAMHIGGISGNASWSCTHPRLFAVLAKSVRNDCRHGNTLCTAFGRRLDINTAECSDERSLGNFRRKGSRFREFSAG